eukprot:COSAG04_NODE_317_length_16987_cov_33.718025_13_plen_611_part_00
MRRRRTGGRVSSGGRRELAAAQQSRRREPPHSNLSCGSNPSRGSKLSCGSNQSSLCNQSSGCNLSGGNQSMAAAAPPAKRQRADEEALGSPLSPALLADGGAVRERYHAAAPYQHAVLEPLCDVARMRLIKEEVTRHLRADFKETDLFKLYQTLDLANLSRTHAQEEVRALSEKLPQVLALRDSLYTAEFRAHMQRITGCPELTDRVDMAVSVFTRGCHLLCHDDVIGTRAVSFIVYLSDEDWQLADGGALELYPLEGQAADPSLQQGVPAALPAAGVLPQFNSMAIFAVQPGRSYHAVQEVYTERSPRLSIQGWYHAAAPPPGADMASLSQLKAGPDGAGPGPDPVAEARFAALAGVERRPDPGAPPAAERASAEAAACSDDTDERAKLSAMKLGELSKRARLNGAGEEAIEGALDTDNPKAAMIEVLLSQQRGSAVATDTAAYEAAWVLTAADRTFLARWVHPTYLKDASFEGVRKQFAEEGSVQLQKFLDAARAEAITAAVTARDNAEFDAGGWPGSRRKPEYRDGLADDNDGWGVVGPAHMQRYLRFDGKSPSGAHPAGTCPAGKQSRRILSGYAACKHSRVSLAGLALGAVKDVLFRSAAFARLL